MHAAAIRWWADDATIQRFVCDLIAAKLTALRPTSLIPPPATVGPTLHLARDLGVDSMEMVALATALSEALHLHESGIEDRLLVRHTIGDWVAVAREGLEAFSGAMTFRTSGSGDVPKRCTHTLADLWQEVTELAPLFAQRRRVLSAVRSHHIYGFLWSVLLPRALELPDDSVVDLRGTMPSSLGTVLRDGDVVIGYPEFWGMVAAGAAPIPLGVMGITSTAPCPDDVARALAQRGLGSLLQIYGSTETGGVGVRRSPDQPYALFPFWRRVAEDTTAILRSSPDGGDVLHEPQDTLEWTDDRRFRPIGRIDHAIQVAGVNVFPAKVRRVLVEHPDVVDAAVRRMGLGEGRLKAFIVPAISRAGDDSLRAELETWAASRLSAPERPRAFTFGASIPVDAAGKLADWRMGQASDLSPR